MKEPPYPTDAGSLFVAYYASAEMGCHLALGWGLPMHVLDLCIEFRNLTNGLTLPCGRDLLGALQWFGLRGVEAIEKESMRALAMRGGPWTSEERDVLLDYCESDVAALVSFPRRRESRGVASWQIIALIVCHSRAGGNPSAQKQPA